MVRDDYKEKFSAIKNEILDEIRKLVPEGTSHVFNEPFYVHYIDGEVSTTEICNDVENDSGMIIIRTKTSGGTVCEVCSFEVYFYCEESFLDILENLQKDLRKKQLQKLHEILKGNGEITFPEEFKIVIKNNGQFYDCSLKSINYIDGQIQIKDQYDGYDFTNDESELPSSEIQKILEYAENNSKKTYDIKVSGSFTRYIEVEAYSYEEAIKKAKVQWKNDSLLYDDINGESFE